jgi:hypothetical protein
MRHGGSGFATAAARKFGKEVIAEGAGDVGEGVAVEEKERRAAMAGPQVVEGFAEGGFYEPPFVPISADCRKALSIRSVLRSTSFAHSSVVADDRLPVPVCEKSGSGL